MTEPIACPSCQAMNRAGLARCRSCGRDLRSKTPPAITAVGLQRVMAGEVFAAVVGNEAAAAEAVVPSAHSPGAPAGDDAETHRALAEIVERFRDRAKASGQRFKPYSAEHPRTPERVQDKVAVTRQLESGARAFREKHYETAVGHLLRAISKDDRDPRSWALLGEAYLRGDRPYKAAVGYLRTLDLEPRNAVAWLGLSRALKATGDLVGARDVLDRTLAVSPDLAEAWSERGQVLEALNDKDEAAKSFSRALELRPDHPTARERYDRLAPAELAATRAAEATPPVAVVEPPASPSTDEEDFPDFTDLAELPPKEAGTPPSAEGPRERPSRVRTYIEGLDETISGGIPWGQVVLLEGSPGTLKSSLGFSILLQNAARDGMHCLYLSLEERTSSLLKQMGSLGLHLHVNKGSLVVLDPRAARAMLDENRDWVDALQSTIAAIRSQRGLDLIVIDSLEALEVLAKFKDHRQDIFRLFEWLRDLDITSFVITERPDWVVGGHVIQGRWDEDFLADGVVQLRQHLVSDLNVQRRLRVVKLRGTRHETGYLGLVLDGGRFRVTHLPA